MCHIGSLYFGIQPATLKSAIEELNILGDEVEVTEENYVYTITFLTDKGKKANNLLSVFIIYVF